MSIKARFEEIEQRLNSITAPKWKLNKGYNYNPDDDDYKYGYRCLDDISIITDDGVYIAQTSYDNQGWSSMHNVKKDSEFIAHAPEDIAFLLDLIRNNLIL